MSAEPSSETPASDPQAVEVDHLHGVVEPTHPTAPSTSKAPATETKPEATEATPAAASELPKEEKVGKDAVKIEAQPIASGHLGYKAPGLLK